MVEPRLLSPGAWLAAHTDHGSGRSSGCTQEGGTGGCSKVVYSQEGGRVGREVV